jgi:hypothetical protein
MSQFRNIKLNDESVRMTIDHKNAADHRSPLGMALSAVQVTL